MRAGTTTRRSGHLYRTAFLIVLFFATQAQGFADSTVFYILSGVGQFTDSGPGTVSAQKDSQRVLGSALLDEGVVLEAGVGHLHAFIISHVKADGVRSGGNAGAFGISTWDDDNILTVDGMALGAAVDIHASLSFSGSLDATASFTPPQTGEIHTSFAASGVTIEVVGSGVTPGVFESKNSVTGITVGNIPGSIPVDIVALNGFSFPVSYHLKVNTSAGGGTGDAIGDTVEALAIGSATNTLKWGGISSVTDHDTGELIANWSITSDSGFDYSKPFSAPEPSTGILSAAGLLLGIAVLRRRAPRAGSETIHLRF